MQLRCLIFVVTLATAQAGLLRKPKVYNALITTDENLTPSRAFPVIQPVLQEAGVAYSSFSSPYVQPLPAVRFFNPYNNYQDSPYGIEPHDYQQPRSVEPTTTESVASAEQVSQATKTEKEAPPAPIPETKVVPPAENEQVKPLEKSPIPLNKYGYPPSLVPVSQFPPAYAPLNYQAYPYEFPTLFDPTYNAYQPAYPVLPPLGAFPTAGGAVAPQPLEPERVPDDQNNRINPQQPVYAEYADQYGPYSYEPQPVEPQPDRVEATEPQQKQPEPLFATYGLGDSIKNHQNKNKDIPDVPIPPLPTSRAAKN